MSGTRYGTCVLHVSPESYVGGPLALVKDGDSIALDIPNRKLDLLVPESELASAARSGLVRCRWSSAAIRRCIASASRRRDKGCDFDFL